MAKQSKRFLDISKEVQSSEYSPNEAVDLAKKLSKVKFDEAVELHVSTNADPKQADQNLREVAELPHGTGKDVRVLVFAQGDDARIAKEAGADYISDDELVKKIEDGSNTVISLVYPINNTLSIEIRKSQNKFIVKEK